MTDDRKRTLQQFFDGELSQADRAGLESALVEDAEANRYLMRLESLRRVALQHNPSATRPVTRPIAVPSRPFGMGWRWGSFIGIAAAAVVAFLVWHSFRPAPHPQPQPNLVGAGNSSSPSKGVSTPPPESELSPAVAAAPLDLDAQRHEWANGAMPPARDRVRALLDVARASHGRAPAEVEILAIELANAPAESFIDAGRAAAQRTTLIRSPLHRAGGALRAGSIAPSNGPIPSPSETGPGQGRIEFDGRRSFDSIETLFVFRISEVSEASEVCVRTDRFIRTSDLT